METAQTLSNLEGDNMNTFQGISGKSQADELKPVGFLKLFRFATKFDFLLMIIGSIGAIALGAAMPAFSYIWGQTINSYYDQQNMVQQIKEKMLLFVYIGIAAFFAGVVMFGCWMITGERQGIACRKAYLRCLLKQQIGWFDVINQTQLSSKFATDTFAFQGALGQKIGSIIMSISTLIAGFTFAFVTGWLMTLVMLATFPALGLSGIFFVKTIGEKDKRSKAKFSEASGMAEQAISAIKTVKQLNGQKYETEKLKKCLEQAHKKVWKYGFFIGLGNGLIFFVLLSTYSLGFWFGSRCVIGTDSCLEQQYSTGDVLIVFFSIIFAGFNLGQLSPALKKIEEGRNAAARIYQLLERQPQICDPPNGLKIQNLNGIFKFENVSFAYPKDPSTKILNNLSLEFNSKKNGLVGISGCGKSTVLQLLMRFYDPDQGTIYLDGYDLKTLDLKWLRQQFGYVGQQPVLFATSIKENLLFGSENATGQEIKEAINRAQAGFVYQLEKGLQTYVGYGGSLLSGGQKQRIAIARAILRKPKILLLDEATSALDRRNQKLIQKTLDSLSSDLTTITVAHRVKTIMMSNMIFVFEKGGIKEKGKFNELQYYKNFSEQQNEEFQENQKVNPLESQEKEEKIKVGQPLTSKEKKEKSKKKSKNLKYEEKFIFRSTKNKNSETKISSSKDQQNYEQKSQKKYDKQIFRRVFKYSRSKLPILIVGILMSILTGGINPTFSMFLAWILEALLIVEADLTNQDALDNINLYALAFFLFAIFALIVSTVQFWFFNIIGEDITMKIRVETYEKILKMPISWFDIPQNNAGTLTARLSIDAQQVSALTTQIMSMMIQNSSNFVTGVTIAFIFQWRTALVGVAMLPFLVFFGIMQLKVQTGFSDETDDAYKDSSNLIMESMVNIRTVSSFGYEGSVINRYDKKMGEPLNSIIKKGIYTGCLFGISQTILFVVYGLLFYLGSIFVRDNPDVEIKEVFTTIFAIVFSGMTIGNSFQFMPDIASSKNSAANLFQILDSQDEQQMQEIEKSKKLKHGFQGAIQLKNIDFKYQSRNEYVFKNMNLQIGMGQKAAFVGPSGCGKSTIIQLLQRFYDPENGEILINNINIKDFDIYYLREQFGVVSQEPVLFNTSFKENIIYNKKNITNYQFIEAVKQANALSFIQQPEKILESINNQGKGHEKNVGIKGYHISGGQKQRVAIARSIVRNPHVLLLDEATSALDKQNQIIVQQSLDNIMKGKTTLTIAHRIETIKNSDIIYVFQKGKIVESGNYCDLVKKKGYFYNLERGTQFI